MTVQNSDRVRLLVHTATTLGAVVAVLLSAAASFHR